MRQPDSKFQYIQYAPTDICLLVPPHLEKWGNKNFFSLAPLANPVSYPHLKIRGAAHDCDGILISNYGYEHLMFIRTSLLAHTTFSAYRLYVIIR